MGGNIALNFALTHPERVRALIVADTGAGSDETAEWNAAVHTFAEAAERDGVEAFADMACANPLFGRYIAQGAGAERFIRACLMTHRAHGIAHTAREVLAHRFMAEAMPRTTAVVIPRVGHLTNLEAPDAFNRAVSRFLSSTATRTRI